jgi:hypothetical protein
MMVNFPLYMATLLLPMMSLPALFPAAKWADQTSLGTPGTTETAGALRSPPRAYGEPRRLLSFAPFQSSSGECRLG